MVKTKKEIDKIIDDYLNCGGACRECKANEKIDYAKDQINLDYCYLLTALKDSLMKEVKEHVEKKIQEAFNEI